MASKLAKGIPQGQAMTIAVTDFPERKQVCGLGQFVAERLNTLLSQHTQCRLVERRRLELVLQELKFSMSELVDPDKAKKLGRMLGVQGLVIGTVSDLGSTLDLDARIIDIETDVSLPGASTSIVKDDAIRALSADCADSPRPGSASPQTGSGPRQRGTAPPARLNPTGLDKRQILDLLRGDVPSARIAELVKEKGLKFSLSAKDLGDVRAQGGDDELIDAISRAPGPDR